MKRVMKLRKKPIRKMTDDELWKYHQKLVDYKGLVIDVISKIQEEERWRRGPDL
jgi:hypothetical protein